MNGTSMVMALRLARQKSRLRLNFLMQEKM